MPPKTEKRARHWSDRYEGVRTPQQCETAWALYEQLKFLEHWGAPPDLIERQREWLDWELLVTYVED